MKKIIALLLALTLCLGLFAGCDQEPADNGSTGLADAKAYLEAMYKEESEITAVDYSRVGVVMIDGVSYTVTWTVDNEAIKITAADKTCKIELPDTLEDISYTLTATIADAEGNTETLTFARKVPAAAGLPATIEDGTYVILSGNLTMSALAESSGYGYPTATEITVTDGTVSGHVKADVLTITNVEGGITIQDAYGRYFYLKGSYNSFNVDATMPAEGAVWELLANGDNYLLVNAMNKKTLAYSTSYTSWGAYPELTDDHNSLLTILPATAPEGGDEPAPAPVEPQLPPVTEPTADTAYKFGMIQVTNGNTVYLNGEVSGRYLGTTEDEAAALDFYVETVDGGVKIYYLSDGTKNYIELYLNDEGKQALKYGAEGTVWQFNAEISSWFSNLEGTDYYMGSYSNFATISASKTSFINADNAGVEQFPAGFFAVATGGEAPVGEAPVDGQNVNIYYPDGGTYVTSTADGNKLAAGTADEAAVWTVSVDENGYYTFTCDGKYLTSGETGNALSLEDAASDYSLWEVTACEGGFLIRNVNAAYNGNANQYLEHYSGFTTFGFKDTSNPAYYTFQFEVVE